MAKYIIEIPDDGKCQYRYNEDTKELKFPCPRLDPNSFMGLDITISGVTPYTEPDREAIENEVWENTWKMFLTPEDFGATMGDSYSEAKAKYNAWKKEKEEIHVGDEVEYPPNKAKGIVIQCHVPDVYAEVDKYAVFTGTFVEYLPIEWLTKTGRAFPEVEKLLERMREQE